MGLCDRNTCRSQFLCVLENELKNSLNSKNLFNSYWSSILEFLIPNNYFRFQFQISDFNVIFQISRGKSKLGPPDLQPGALPFKLSWFSRRYRSEFLLKAMLCKALWFVTVKFNRKNNFVFIYYLSTYQCDFKTNNSICHYPDLHVKV